MSRLTCEEAMRQFFAYLDRALSGTVTEEMEAHLEECLSCCDRLAFSRQLDGFMKARLPDGEIPVDLEQRVRERLATAMATAAGPETCAPATSGPLGPPSADEVLDGGDRACGELLIAIKAALDAMRPGQVLMLVSRDHGTRVDLPIWCRMTRHTLLWSGDHFYYIRRRES